LVDCRTITTDPETIKKGEEQRERLIAGWVNQGDITIELDSMGFLAFDPRIAPFSIFPLPDRICIELALGLKAYRVKANVSAIMREFEHFGWRTFSLEDQAKLREVDPSHPVSTADGLFVIQKDSTVGIGIDFVTQMAMELIRPKSLAKIFEILGAHFPKGSGKKYLEYQVIERPIWR
jgi:hypothetical protein